MWLSLAFVVAHAVYGCQITQSTPDRKTWYWMVHVWREREGVRVTRLYSIREATGDPEKDMVRAARDCAAGQRDLEKEVQKGK